MFSNSKNRDYRARFQQHSFRSKLVQARGYKRASKPRPASNGRLANLYRLVPLWGKAAAGLLVILFIYLVYVPNFFYIQTVRLNGAEGPSAGAIRLLVSEYLVRNPYWPQFSELALSKPGLANYLLQNDAGILRVEQVKKVWPHSLAVTVTLRQDQFLLTAPEGTFTIDNSLKLSAISPSSTQLSNLIKINLIAGGQAGDGQAYQNPQQLSAISFLNDNFAAEAGTGIDHFEAADEKDADITVYAQNGAKFLFDSTSDLGSTLQKLHLLLSSIAPGDAARLDYVDMRLKNRGYVCLKNTPCAVPLPSLSGSASSTPYGATTSTSTLNNLP